MVTAFGASHVVGGAYHTARASMFAVQDRVAGAVDGNVIAELDPITGAERAQWHRRWRVADRRPAVRPVS